MIELSEQNDIFIDRETWYDAVDMEEEERERENHMEERLGDKLQEEKSDDITRIYFQNLNGLKWDNEGGTWPAICQAMAALHVDIMGFVEVNHDTSKYEVQTQLEKVAAKYYEHKRLVTGTSNRKVRRTFKPGGTMMMSVMGVVGHIQETSRDRMGRWVATRYQGQGNQKTTIIMAYQVCRTKRTGNNTAVNQQFNMLLEEAVNRGSLDRVNRSKRSVY
jgi:hypothetical protein